VKSSLTSLIKAAEPAVFEFVRPEPVSICDPLLQLEQFASGYKCQRMVDIFRDLNL